MSSSSSQPIQIDIRSPAAVALQSSIQDNLVSRGWVDASDPMMAEYVLVMLANAKGREQIDQELAELIGEGVYEKDFTQWLWSEAARMQGAAQGEEQPSGSGNAAMETAQQEGDRRSKTRSPTTYRSKESETREVGGSTRDERSQRGSYRDLGREDARSRSPGFRRSASPPVRSDRQTSKAADHWEPRNARGEDGERWTRGGYRQQRRAQRQPRELFATARSELQDPASRLSPPRTDSTPIDDSMQEDATSATILPTGPREMRIRGSAPSSQANNAGRELFSRSINAASASNSASNAPPTGPRRVTPTGPANSGLSLLARAGIPDPRAPAFVPNFQPQPTATAVQGPSLSSRLDPMLPVNAPLRPSSDPATSTHSTDFPTKPLQSSLCRYASACTNPMCEYSHPSPKASLAKRRGEIKEDPILTSQTPCRFGVECNNVECTFSHISPAVFFLSQRGGNNADGVGIGSTAAGAAVSMGESTSIPCRFGEKCSNPSCAYKHVDAAGNVIPSPALTRLLNPSAAAPAAKENGNPAAADAEMSEEFAAEEKGDVDISLGASTGVQSGKGPDGKPLALDRPLDDSSSSSSSGGVGGGGGGGGARPCKFGMACTREGCWFSHPPGHTLSHSQSQQTNSTAGAGAGKMHISDRLSRFNREGAEDANGEGGVERIIPAV
ncbi:hypothetical protein BCV69DRAFT_283608 [Microstroma glucosiphilum]|uniref:C3H1-type domain-containing protein n=1 Tax=Pseudomicrostroma glucosiphilum TaxID=1684307 RepID=A0A316UAL6_9BASI|nr:hypothetical protein BCV69DRAFT_283608 [Pseudomicrostroma glucosiphilum]PWN20075.1 hypothetical protein BCV69DRAFT_283608 [Pseudomicrostroma glucosiphilum]